MSADEFDPAIERLFNQAPTLTDAPLFAAGVEARLASSSRVRTFALTAAGLVGGFMAVRESLTVQIGGGPESARALGQGVNAATGSLQTSVQAGLEQVGLAGLELGSMGAMQMFWITAAALVVLAAAGAVRLSQEV